MKLLIKNEALAGLVFLLRFYWSIFPTNWGNVANKPNISVSNNSEQWSGSPTKNIGISSGLGAITISGAKINITVRDSVSFSDAVTGGKSVALANYPINWPNVANKPMAMELFGYVFEKAATSSDPDEYWPAVAVKDSYSHDDYSVYKFNGSGWVRGTASEFISFVDNDPHS